MKRTVLPLLLLLNACAAPPPPPTRPAAESWSAEAELVVRGLKEVEQLWKAKQKDAARTLCVRVYEDRWEPNLERAQRQMEGDVAADQTEYIFGQLRLSLEGRSTKDHVPERIQKLTERVRQIAANAETHFPPPGQALADPSSTAPVLRPLTPNTKPNWSKP